ncbi:MAG: zinc ribbon domain-containing protein [Candidatus Thermoplasmatota archaeon]|nr:zinc ribbon domain-containing protein [Candidatus Thermoplasmatota archaeon]
MKRSMVVWSVALMFLITSIEVSTVTFGEKGSACNTFEPADVPSCGTGERDQGISPFPGSPSLSDLCLGEVVHSPNTDAMISDVTDADHPDRFDTRMYCVEPPTRASDAENENDQHDFANGSKINGWVETIDGTLTYDPDGTVSDRRDWYKLQVTDIDELANTVDGVRKVSIELSSYTDGSGGYDDLYEYSVVNDQLADEFADLLSISLIYYDPWVGYVDMGDGVFLFDDQDDSDGWVWDGDNSLYPGDNWTTSFRTPVNSEGEEDPDGFANGLTEVGWYYIGVELDFYLRDQFWSRDLFSVEYSLKIDASTRESTDQGSNAFEDAQFYGGDEPKYLDSRSNQVDWYKLQGSDPSKIWNISITLDRKVGFGFIDDPDYMDNWLWTFVVWRNFGEDRMWNTEDDLWVYDYAIMSFFITGGRFVSNTNQNMSFNYRSRALENERREVYIGIVMEPVMIRIENDEIKGFYYYSPFPSWNNYSVTSNIREEVPNRSPERSELEISSDWPGHSAGGHYGTIFTFNITYTDQDNDPPEELNLVLDPLTVDEKVIDMTQYPADPEDIDHSDGKEYSYSVMGEELGDQPSPHVVMVNATDLISVTSIRVPGGTGDLYYNRTLYVWDDDPVFLNPINPREFHLTEDGGSEEMELEAHNVNGIFSDPERDFLGFQIFNTTSESWDTGYDSDLLHIDVEERSGYWYAVLTPKANQNGNETVKFMGSDEHSNITADVLFMVEPVNDLPKVFSVMVHGAEFEVDDARPEYPVIDLSDLVLVLEDEELVIEIIAEDMDTDREKQQLNYELERYQSDDWEGELEVDPLTGRITLVPNNDDVRDKNSNIVVSIDDGTIDGVIKLRIILEITNVRDVPRISLPASLRTVYEKGEEISIIPILEDPDLGDTLVVSVNMEDEIDGIDPITDQLPHADLVKDLEWGFNEIIGSFWLKTDDWKIWQGPGGFIGIVNITVVFMVVDSMAAMDFISVDLSLTCPEGPIYPEDYDDPLTAGEYSYSIYDEHPLETPSVSEGLRVNFKVDRLVRTVFGDEMEPRWEYDGEVISKKKDFDHTFDDHGPKTVYLYFEKDNMDTTAQKMEMKFILVVYEEPLDHGKDNASLAWVVPVLIVAVLLIITMLGIGFFLILRGKKEPPAPSDENYLKGSDPVEELVEGPGHLPQGPVGISPVKDVIEMNGPPPGRDEGPLSIPCPHCGSPVQDGWFLCPECKNPLE